MTARVNTLSPAKLATILGVTFLLLAGATWLILIMPKQSKVSSLSGQVKSAQDQLSQLTGKASAAHKQVVSQSLMTTRALPTDPGMPQLVLQLSRIAVEEHVSLDSIVPTAPVAYSGYQAIPMTITLSGNFFGIEGFLQQLRHQVVVANGNVAATGRLYDVQGVTIATSPTTAPKVTATLMLDAFSYTGIAQATTPPAGTTTTTR